MSFIGLTVWLYYNIIISTFYMLLAVMRIDEENYFIMLVLKTCQRTLIRSKLFDYVKAKELFEKSATLYCVMAVPL